jgi:hypothetical protein
MTQALYAHMNNKKKKEKKIPWANAGLPLPSQLETRTGLGCLRAACHIQLLF